METITTIRNIANSSGRETVEEIRTAFDENSQELMWLAEFLTGDDRMASACVFDAYELTQSEYQMSHVWFWTWPREATIRSTLDLLQGRIQQLASVYESRACFHRQYAPLPPEAIELVEDHSETLQLRLDALCRFVLILCGVEQRSTLEAALALGVSRDAVEAAYCTVLESLDVITCEVILESNRCAATFN